MRKKEYLNELFNILMEHDVDRKEVDKIIKEYEELYGEAYDYYMDDEKVIKKLGSPNEVYHVLKHDLKYRKSSQMNNKFVALSPFIALILFFAIGMGFDAYEYSWMSFLLIPISAILLNVKGRAKFIAISPFISLVVFMILGFVWSLWHPGWLVFLLIPMTAITLEAGKDRYVALSPFVITFIYVLVSYFNQEFLIYGWGLYIFVLVFASIRKPFKIMDLLVILTSISALIIHWWIGLATGNFEYLWLVYIVPLLFALYSGVIKIDITFFNIKKHPILFLISILMILLFIGLGFLLPNNGFSYSWVTLLVIPMCAIYSKVKFKYLVAYTPFLSVIIFMTLGYFFGLWNIAWIIFLSIPIMGILTPKENYEKEEKA